MALLDNIRALSDHELDEALALAESLAEEAKYDWNGRLRPEQKWPEDTDADIEVKLAGRGFGKTLSGAVWTRDETRAVAERRWAVVAPTFADVRDTCFEGESGILRVTPPSALVKASVSDAYNRSLGEITFANGSRIKGFSGEEPDRLRGPQHHGIWWEESAACRRAREAWDQGQFGLRLGTRPRQMVTTTPKPTPFMRWLLGRSDVHITRGSTFDNAANLAPSALASLLEQYDGTRLGRQELEAELLLDTPGAVATYELLDAGRVRECPESVQTVVSVDPAVTATPESDETGIAIQRRGVDGDCYAIADRTCRLPVDSWARRAVNAAIEYEAGMILYEKNQGADAIGSVLRQAMRDMGVVDSIKLEDVGAHKSKFDRALALQQWIEQGRWHIVGSLPELEEQLTSWTIDSPTSPDRIDAFVHGFNKLMLARKGFALYG